MEEHPKVKQVLDSGIFSGFGATLEKHLGGVMVRELEDAFCSYFDVGYAVSMSSGTACLHAALIACGVQCGDEVIVPAMSFSSSASCVLMAGARPIFADIDEDTFNLDVWAVDPSTQTKAIIPVHLHGLPANMHDIMFTAKSLGIRVIEDASQAIGAKYNGKYVGTIGDCGVFSFNQNKPLFAGSGGMLITNDREIAEKARLIRNHGETQSDILGYNYRLGEIEAALILEQLPQLEQINKGRIELANYLTESLSGIEEIIPPVAEGNIFFRYAMKYRGSVHRNRFQEQLIRDGVFFGRKDYGEPLYRQPIYRQFNPHPCPVAERLWRDEIMVTEIIKPPNTQKDIDRALSIIRKMC